MAKRGDTQTTTVDPNDSPGSFKQEHEVGASDTMSHPCSYSPVDGNYSAGKSSGGGGEGRRQRSSTPASDEYSED